MRIEVTFSSDDLLRALAQAFPLTIRFGEAKQHSLTLSDLGEAKLVAGVGLRVACKARVRWPLLGIDVPMAVSSLAFLLLPSIGESEGGATLAFRASVEHADFANLPALMDDRIVATVNAKLAARQSELSWKFMKALTHVAPLPATLEPLESLAIRPAWGKVQVTEDAVIYTASFDSSLVRRGSNVST
jgi:hypothetical protein